jgi:acetate kinase
VVHGGPFRIPTAITDETLTRIKALEPLAPLHNPMDVALIEAVRGRLPHVRHVAVFDTAFHWTMPDAASTYAIPHALAEKYSLRRYGFHGISHRYVSKQALALMHMPAHGSRLISCHLGNGASVCAIHHGHSVDTSMGLTPMEGLIMGSRCGDIDPGLLLFLERTGIGPDALDHLLNSQSGLLGLSGLSGDVRVLERAASTGDGRAFLALEAFAYRVAKYIGAYAVALDGLDAILFTGGIGENSEATRRRICRHLGVLGVSLDMARNLQEEHHAPLRISSDTSRAQIWVIPTDEEAEIAREVMDMPVAS